MNVNTIITKDYENKPIGNLVKTKPKQTQYKANTNPIPEKPKMNVTSILTKDYENERLRRAGKTKPIQTQSNPTGLQNTSPKKVLTPLAWPIK